MFGKIKIIGPYDPVEIVSTCAGDGKAVKQFYLDEKIGEIKPLLDADGKQVYHSLYDDIQSNKSTNDYKKVLEQQGSLDDVSTNWPEADYSDIGSFTEIVNANNSVQEKTGKNIDLVMSEYQESLFDADKLKKENSKSQEPSSLVDQPKGK